MEMKILKYLLLSVLFLIMILIGVLFFSGKIIESKLNNKETQIENFRFSIKKREFTFDNITLNGNKMGAGRAKLSLKMFFLNILDKEVYINEMEFTNADFNRLFAAPDENIDRFISKIQVPDKKTAEKNTENVTDKILELESDTNEILNFNFVSQMESLEKLKQEFSETQDLDTKITKLKEITSETEKIKKEMTDKKSVISDKINELDNENVASLKEYIDNLEELDNTIKSSNVDNIKRITFIDKGFEITQDLNKSLKISKLIEDFNESNLTIKKVILKEEDSEIVIYNTGLYSEASSAQYQNHDVVYNINEVGKTGVFNISIDRDKLMENVTYDKDKIVAIIKYTKLNFLPNIPDIVIETKLNYNNETLHISSNNSVTKEQEDFIKESIEGIKQERLEILSKNYSEDNTKINSILDELYSKEKELDSQILKLKVLSTSSNIINKLGE